LSDRLGANNRLQGTRNLIRKNGQANLTLKDRARSRFDHSYRYLEGELRTMPFSSTKQISLALSYLMLVRITRDAK
jgi:hypothetical protein